MRVLIGCETSGVVREAFRAAGHDAWSNDLRPAQDGSPYHLQMDLNHVLHYPRRVLGGMPRWMLAREWDLLIAHPTCTYLCNSGVSRLTRVPPNPGPGVLYGERRRIAMLAARDFFLALWESGVPRICLENPVMHGYANLPKATQYVQPNWFGDDASKLTGLWLRGLDKLEIPDARDWCLPRRICKRCGHTTYPPAYLDICRCIDKSVGAGEWRRWSNQTDSGQNKLTPSVDRWQQRSNTYPGIARAMAAQWRG